MVSLNVSVWLQFFCLRLNASLCRVGPAVSGAHNTIVCARAAKDLISSLCSGLLTIGPRFGGALDESAKMFCEALVRQLLLAVCGVLLYCRMRSFAKSVCGTSSN